MPRVAYNGHDPDGQDLVYEVDGVQQSVHVGQNTQVDVPASVRDELVKRDGWSEVKDPGGAKAKAEKEED